MTAMKKLLDDIGLDGGRLEMYNLSSSEGVRWRNDILEMLERVRKIGPNPLRNKETISS